MAGYDEKVCLATWIGVLDLAEKLESPHTVAKDYTKADLIRDLRELVPGATAEPARIKDVLKGALAGYEAFQAGKDEATTLSNLEHAIKIGDAEMADYARNRLRGSRA